MNARRVIRTSLVIHSAILAGCAAKPRRADAPASPQPVAAVSQPPVPPAPATTLDDPFVGQPAPKVEPIPTDAITVAPRSLAEQAADYARTVETAMAKREPVVPHPTPQNPDTHAPSGVAAAPAPTAPPAPAPAPAAAPAETAASRVTAAPASAVPPPAAIAPASVTPAPPEASGRQEGANTAAHVASAAVPAGVGTTSVAAVPGLDGRPGTPGEDLRRKLDGQIKSDPRDAAFHLEYQLLQFVLNESVPDLAAFGPLPAEDRDLIVALVDGLSNFRSGLRAESNMMFAKKVAPLVEFGDRLRSQSELRIQRVALCARVDGFGIYEPIEPARFTAGVQSKPVIYTEIENFASRLNGEKMWETVLQLEAVLYTEQGLPVWRSQPAEPKPDRARSRRRDFCVLRHAELSDKLPIGRYLLKVSVTDQQVNHVAEQTVPIEIVAK